MRVGFTFRGQHSSAFKGVTVRTNDRPIRPNTKEETFNPTNDDSEHSFASANPYKHEFYEDKIYQIQLHVVANDLSDLQSIITKLGRWIMGSGELIFDDTPLVKWDARIIDTVQYMPEHGGKEAVFLIKYRVKPFAELVFNTIDGPCLDDELDLDSDIPLAMDKYFIFSGAGTYNVKNIGDVPVRPIITITGATKTVSLEVNEVALSVPGNAVIDCDRYVVTNLSGQSLMSQMNGEFFELSAGDNTMNVTTSESVKIEVEYEPKYINNIDTKELRFDKDVETT